MQEQEWNIRARSEACMLCGREFDDGEEFNTMLASKGDELLRTDICDRCWDDEQHRDAAISVWRAVFRLPPPKPEEPLKKETSESLLRRLMETEEESERDVIFVLAVDLERRRIFQEREMELLDSGEKKRVYEHKKTGEVFIIRDPDLNLRELEDVQGRVIELLLHKESQENPAPEAKSEEEGTTDSDARSEDMQG